MKPLPEHILLRTKHVVPVGRKKLIARPRLIEKLRLSTELRLISLCAPAGFGKTTLLGQWAAHHLGPIGWLSLDERDDDPIRFWRYVLQAVIHAAPHSERYEMLHRLLPAASMDTFIDAFINELCGEPQSLLLVWDDFQFIQTRSLHESIVSFIDRLPEHVCLVISSRTELLLPTAKWYARGEYVTIDAQLLQFTLSETVAFCEQTGSLPLNAASIEKLQQRTEGWAAALQLLSLSVYSEADYERIMTGYNGGNEAVEDFLVQEVVAGLPEQLRSFLGHTSILERMDAALCEAVTGRSDGATMLEQLKAENLFMFALDETGTWYRYHQLFAEALQSRLLRNDPEELLACHRRAALHLSDRGFHSAAISHAIAAEDTPLIERLMAKHAEELLKLGEFTILLRWMDSFPSHSPKRQPETVLLHAFVLVASGQPQRAEEIMDYLNTELETIAITDTERYQQLQSGMLFVKSNLLYISGRFEQWMSFANGGLNHMLPHSSIYYSFNYNLTEPLVRFTAFGIKGVITQQMEQIAHLFTRTLKNHNWNDSLINLYVRQTLAEGYYEWNRLDEAEVLLHEVDRAAREPATLGLLVPNRIVQAMMHQATGQYYLAHDTIDEALTLLQALKAPTHWLRNLHACRIRLYTLEGRIGAARRELAKLDISPTDRPLLSRYYEYMALIRLLAAQRKLTEALRLLRLLMPQAVRENSLIHMAELTLFEACIEEWLGQRSKALNKLREGLAMTEASSYVRSYVDQGATMLGLLQQLSSANSETDPQNHYSQDYVNRLIGEFQNACEDNSDASAPSAELTQSELALLGLIEEGASNKQIAAKLALSEGTVKVYLSRIYSKLEVSSRTQALLAARKLGLLELRS